MKVFKKPEDAGKFLRKIKCCGKSIGFVPTMGALHAGHLSLIRQARKDNKIVGVSIFVNPMQFAKNEDLKRYPRPINNDLELCRKEGVDFVFLPLDKSMYRENHLTFVDVEKLSNLFCGPSRPGHFRGVATIVAKLLNIIMPDILYLGQKDAQQAIIIKRMINDLNFPVKVKVMPIVREKDGLALSSRNIYLNKSQRQDAVVLSKALLLAKSLIKLGQRDASRIIKRMKELINRKKQAKIDYVAIVDQENLLNIKKINQNCLVLLAVKIGKTRLIDNIVINYA